MASEKEAPCQNYCANDPNFAIICSFFDRFAISCGITYPTFAELQDMIENTQDVPPELIDLHVKLLRKIRRSVAAEKWERALIKFCHSYLCSEEGWELERCGYKKCKVPVRLKILKTLLDAQFDLNSKFKNDINKLTPEELRLEPLGRDKVGQSYWCQFDSAANVRVYKEDQDEETWALVAKDREGLVGLITQLSSGEELLELELINEDSNSQEVENPIIDTGQVEQTSEENTVDSVASKSENVKEEDSSVNDNSTNKASNNHNSQEVEGDNSCGLKSENGDEKTYIESSKSENMTLNESHDKVCLPNNGDDCHKNEVKLEENPSEVNTSHSKDDSSTKDSNQSINPIPVPKTKSELGNENESELVNENGVSQVVPTVSQPVTGDSTKEEGEVKDVAEEIKQRSLSKSISNSMFKGKVGKSSSGSKLDKIFCHKLEQSNIFIPNDNQTLENKSLIDDDSCSQTSIKSHEQDKAPVIDGNQVKRKADEVYDLSSKKICMETDLNTNIEPEVGEEIEEPVMIIKGEGSGQECDTGNPGNESEDVVSDKMKNTTSNKSDIILTDTPNANRESASEGFSPINVLKNGIMNDNRSVNEGILNRESECIPNHTDLSNKEDQESNVSGVRDIKTCADDSAHQETENEKSIEEQLSDLTGEGLSPKSAGENQNEFTENSKDKVIVLNNTGSEKGIRRKSLDKTSNVEDETVPPEAKKTKVQKDCSDIFGTDDSLPFTGEDNIPVNKKDGLERNVYDSNIFKNTSEKENLKETQPLDTSSVNSEIKVPESTSNYKKNLVEFGNNENNSNGKVNGDNDHMDSVSKLVDEVKDKPSESNDPELKINDKGNAVDPKDSHVTLGEKDESNVLEAADDTGPDDANLSNESIKNESNEENKEPMKLCNKKRIGSIEEKVDDTNCTIKDSENEPLECPEKKKKIVSENTTHGNKENSSDENNITEELDGANLQEEKDDGKETLKTHKTPIKKTPKPRRKVFTPKSRKNRNKNKLNKVDHPDNILAPEVKNDLTKSSLDDNAPDNEIETTREGGNISEIKEDSKTTAKSIAGRKRRNSRKNTNTDKESEEDLTSDKKANTEADEEIGGKRRKVKGKRTPNKSLRKSIEEKRNCKSSSEEENHSDENVGKEAVKSKEPKKASSAKQKTAKDSETNKNNGGKTKPIKSPKSKRDETSKNKKEDSNDDDEKSDESNEKKKKKSKSQGRNSRAFLGINLNIDLNDTSRSVRQSSRIAQIKIKEQADHKHGEELRSNVDKAGKKSKKKKDENEEALKGTPKKKKKTKKISDDDIADDEPLSDRKKKRRKKRKHPVKAFNERDPWKSSSGSSSEAEEEEEDHFDDIVEEEEDIPLTIKSDHEFSPESDIEADEEWKPVRRARTAQKVKEPTEEAEESIKDLDDFACEKCGKKDHPEWILLCDTCNHGWHASCLRPSLMLIPEGDWHCPPCQHTVLVKKLQETLKIYDRDTKRRENEELRRKRLAYVGISLDNVLPANAHHPKEKASGSESSESAESQSESESEDSDEPVYQLRQRRQGVQSYRFNDFDELINSAIRDEVEGSGTFLPAPVVTVEGSALGNEGEEKPLTNESSVGINGGENKADHVPDTKEKEEKTKKKNREDRDEESSEEEDDEEDEFPRVVPKRTALSRPGRKKHRKLNSLDDPSDDDDDDEDFKGSSSEEEEEEDEDDDSDESGVGRRRSRRGNLEPVRRSSRARKSRFDKEFINDDSEESDAPRRKKTKKLWSESDSESDDSTWGRRKKKKSYGSSRGKKFKKSKKFTIEDELSDLESSKTPKKKRQRKVKYGGLDDLSVEDLPSRRTRGKKINYQEVLGTDSDEDIQKSKSSKKNMIEDDDEFDAEKEKQESAASSGEEESENEEKITEEEGGSEDDDEEESENEVKNSQNMQNKENESHHKIEEKEETKTPNENIEMPSRKTSPPKLIPAKVSPPKVVNKDKPPARRGRPPKAMIAPPPERLVSEDEQYKAVVSKVATVGHNIGEIGGAKAVNVIDYPQKFSETKDFMDPPQPVTPIKIPNSSFDPKLVKRSPPIKIRSGVPVNAGMKSPLLGSPSSDVPLYSVKSPNSDSLHSPPDVSQFPIQRPPISQHPLSARKSINAPLSNLKTEGPDEEELDDEDLMEDIEEEEEEEEEDEEEESDEDVLEEGEIPKKVARRMARMEERMERLEKKKLAKQMEKMKAVQTGVEANQPMSPGAVKPTFTEDQKPNSTPTTQPSQPLLRVVSPLKLMANPPGPLQSTFMNPGMSPRMPIGSPPAARIPMTMRPPQPTNLASGGEASSRRGRGRGKKQEKEEMVVPTGGSVIRGMLQQPQSYPPSHYQQYPSSHPRIPFNPQQRMSRPPFHPGHPHPMDPSPSGGGPINVKQESGPHPVSNPVHIPNKPPVSQPYHPQHRFDPRPPGYPPPQGNPRPQYGSYPPPPVSSAGYHYGSYPPPPQPSMAAPPAREEYVAPPQPQYNEQFSEPPVSTPPASKPYSEEEGGGEFGGLVSYFSSQREEDIDT